MIERKGRISSHQRGIIYGTDGPSPTIGASDWKGATKIMVDEIEIPCKNKDGKVVAHEGDGVIVSRPHAARMTKMDQKSFAVVSQGAIPGVVVKEFEIQGKNGVVVAHEGDGVVTSRPQSVRMPKTDQVSMAIAATARTGVVVSGVPLKEGADVEDAAILTPKRTEYGKQIRKSYENGQAEERRHNMVELVPRTDGMSNTLTGVARDNLLIKKDIVVEGELDGNVIQDKQVYGESGVAPTCMGAGGSGSKTKVLIEGCELEDGETKPMHTPGRAVKRQNGPRLGDDNSFTVTAADKDGVASNENGRLRIRYLTPRECLRLQAFPDEAIDKMIPVLSKSALYKVAGNSIAVCCLKAIFKGIYIDKTFKKTGRQVSLNRWFE